jgi:phosphoglycolate phosphatase
MIPTTLLFDLDGTLTDPAPGIIGCIRFALEQMAVIAPSDDLLATCIGPPLRGTFSMLLGTAESDRIEEAVRFYRQRFADKGLYENEVYTGIPTMLTEVRKSATVYVATSKPTIYAERIVEHFRLDHHFARVFGSELDGRFDDKAELLAHLLDGEGIASEEAVMIGDRSVDIDAAKANGVRSIGVLWGYGSERELLDAGADVLCRSPQELVNCLSMMASD